MDRRAEPAVPGARCGLRSGEAVRVAPEHVADTDAGTMLRVWRSAKTDKYRETPIPPNLALLSGPSGTSVTRLQTPLWWTLSTRTVRRWTSRATAELLDETGEPGRKHVGYHDLRRIWAPSLRSEDVDAMVVCDWGGWDGLETVLDHYRGTHSPQAQRREREKVEWL